MRSKKVVEWLVGLLPLDPASTSNRSEQLASSRHAVGSLQGWTEQHTAADRQEGQVADATSKWKW